MLRSEVGGAKVAGIASNLDDSRQRVLMFPGGEKDLSRGRRNPRSKAAHDAIKPHKHAVRSIVFALIATVGDRGATLKELCGCRELAKPNGELREKNELSGRLTELSRAGMIYATDEVRDGCTVYRARFAEAH